MLRNCLNRTALIGFAVFVGMNCGSSASTAESHDDALADYLSQQLTSVEASLQDGAVDAAEPPATPSNEDWYFRRIWLRVRAKAGVSIPGISSLQLIPEVEFLWEKPYPDGWSKYKP